MTSLVADPRLIVPLDQPGLADARALVERILEVYRCTAAEGIGRADPT